MKDPNKNNIHVTFDGTNQYLAPVYQRYYVWKLEQLEALLDDIENAAGKNSTQFIGATVLQDLGKETGAASPNRYLIVDGQQRLTTIYLLIAAIIVAYIKANKHQDALTYAELYLALNAGQYVGIPKLIPTAQDRSQLFRILEREVGIIDWNFSQHPPDTNSRRRGIDSQWKNIQKHFEQNFYDSRGRLITRKLTKFRDNLVNYLEYIQVTLEKEDDANTVFSKLNFEGITLDIADLVRNDLFSRLDISTNKADRFYKNTWAPFEHSFPKNSFDQFVTIYATIRFGGKYTKARAFPELQKSWASKSPRTIVNELKEYADIYCSLVEFISVAGVHKDVNAQILRFSLMPKSTVTWPYILQLVKAHRAGKATKKQVVDCIHTIESFLVRRAIVGLEPTGLHAVFKGLWPRCGPDERRLKAHIITSTIKCPTDTAVKDALSHENMYSRHITKFVLIQNEILHNAVKGFDNAISDFSIEHILPRSLSREWAKDFSSDSHRKYLNTIGNLTPLTKGQNSNLGDHSWAEKKAKMRGSNWKITQNLSRCRNWNENQIEKRTKVISKWIISEWPEVK